MRGFQNTFMKLAQDRQRNKADIIERDMRPDVEISPQMRMTTLLSRTMPRAI
jgi:hypothetical protein